MTQVRRPSTDPIDFLIGRRFPAHRVLDAPPPLTRPFASGMSGDQRVQLKTEIDAYRKELEAKSPTELQALVDEQRGIARQESLKRADSEEQARPFNAPDAKANLAHWSKMAFWTLEEALALAFDRAPEKVSWDLVAKYVHVSPFAQEFGRFRELAVRAVRWKEITDPVSPGIFIPWARRLGMSLPEELVSEVEARGVIVRDWQAFYEQLKEVYEGVLVDRDKLADACRSLIDERNSLAQQVASLKEDAGSWEFDVDNPTYPSELDIAMQAWRAVSTQRDTSISPKQQLSAWLHTHYPRVRAEQRERIAMVCNWEKQGGRPSSASKLGVGKKGSNSKG